MLALAALLAIGAIVAIQVGHYLEARNLDRRWEEAEEAHAREVEDWLNLPSEWTER